MITFKRYIRYIVILLSVITITPYCYGQSDLILTQNAKLPTLYNPGAAGNSDMLRIRAAGRMQWVGIEHAPREFAGAASMPFKIGKNRIAAGVTVNQESEGLFSNLLLSAQGAFKFKFLKGQLSIGVQAGYYSTKFKGSEVYLPEGDDFHQTTDEAIPTQDVAGNAFDLGAGIWYTHKYFHIGISGVHLMNPKIDLSTDGSSENGTTQYQTELARQLYLSAGGNIVIKNTLFELQPSLLLGTDLRDFAGTVTLEALYNRFLSFGVGYRFQDAVSIMAGVTFKNFYLGYSYDYPLSAIARASSGSHEVVLGYELKLDFSGKNKNKHRSIRIM